MNEDRAARYHRLRRRAAVVSTAAGVALLAGLFATGASRQLTAWAAGAAAPLPWPIRPMMAISLDVAVVALAWELVSLPLVFYRGFVLDRKYGLSSEPLATWVADHLKALGLGLAVSLCAAIAVFTSIRLAPERWWMFVAVVFGGAMVGVAWIAPVWLMPMFYRFKPLDRDALRERLLTLSKRAGLPVLGAFEWGLGEKTTRANAALVGAGRTRRILVSDTLLKDYSEDEIEVILAHELSHHVHHDIWTSLALDTITMAASLWVAHAALSAARETAGISGPGDLAALPLFVLAVGAASLLLSPLNNAWSRHNERRADRFALKLTGRPAAFVGAMRRLAAQNLAEERPSALVYAFFYTHPTIEQRIAAAKSFSPTSA
jgi:STE24 endopeptidase